MAKLSSSEGMTLEICFKDFEHGWVNYEINLLWRDQPIPNEAILGRKQLREKYLPGAIFANDYRESELLPVLKDVLETNQPDYWEPMEPDVILAIYPGMYFPFRTKKSCLVWESDESSNKREEREKLKAGKGVFPDDWFTLMCYVDAYAFKSGEYCGDGISLHLDIRRQELERFYEDLKTEYLDFKMRFGVDQFNREEVGDDWEPMQL